MKNIAVFASGSGTNAEAIIRYFENHSHIQVALVVSNNPLAPVVKMAHQHRIISAIVSKNFFEDEARMSALLQSQQIGFIALAGFLQLIPEWLVKKFPQSIVNIHPALLPKFGGKGMYGKKVHEAVLAAGETESGMTIHYVNAKYDEGEIIAQQKVQTAADENAETLAQKVLQLEHEYYPKAIEKLLM